MRPRKKPLTLALAGIVALLVTLTLSSTQVGAQATPLTPASYINPDTGKPTENPDVDPGSECETPDQTDDQPVVVDPMTDNVHNDACLFDAGGARVDTQATFESSGVGTISACPDPDGMDLPGMEADDKTATLSDSDGDGGNDRCVLSGYEDANTEYHARLVSDTAGTQTVNFCEDPEGDGCANASSVDTIIINWTADDQPDPTALTSASYINPDTGKPTENPDVDPGSECETPDQTDDQPVVVDPMTDNVHNDACLFDAGGARVDTQATFESSGVGTISACPDPDGMDLPGMEADDKTATLSDSDGDGGNDRCVLSGFEDANTEYHARLVSDTAGTQTVNFCEDPEGDGCANAPSVDTITINWTADDQPDPGQVPEGGVDTGVGPPPTSDFPMTATIAFSSAALLSVAALTTWFSRRRQWS